MNLWLESEEINFEKLEKMPLEHDENIATTLLVFTSIVLSQKHGESEFRQHEKSMGKQNIPRSGLSYTFE